MNIENSTIDVSPDFTKRGDYLNNFQVPYFIDELIKTRRFK